MAKLYLILFIPVLQSLKKLIITHENCNLYFFVIIVLCWLQK